MFCASSSHDAYLSLGGRSRWILYDRLDYLIRDVHETLYGHLILDESFEIDCHRRPFRLLVVHYKAASLVRF
jgi:hypothetical protein